MLCGPLLIFAIVLVNARGRIFWEDETLGWVLLRDPSWHHMLRAWNLGADGGGILFYLLGRAWFHFFGDSVLAFRLFSATTFSLAFVVIWAALRRVYPLWVTAFALFNTMFFSPPLTMHYMEGRFYGLLMLGVSLAFYAAVRLDHVPTRVSWRWYLFFFSAHLLLTGCHVLGVVYSLALVTAVVLVDNARGRRRPLLYLSGVAPWLLLLWERKAMIATAQVGKPHFWTKAPTMGQVLGAYSMFSPEIFTVLLLLLLGTAALLPRGPGELRALFLRNARRRAACYVATGCLLLVPVGFLLEGLTGTWLFTDRYLQPLAIAIACVTAELTFGMARGLGWNRLRSCWPRSSAFAAAGVGVAFAALLLHWVFQREAGYTPSVPDFTEQLTAQIPQGLPVVVEDAFTFTELMSRPAGARRDYRFLLDWPYAVSPKAPRMGVTQFHLMRNWQQAGYFAAHLTDREQFLGEHARFLVVSNSILGKRPEDRPEKGDPIALSLAHTPGYTVQHILQLDRVHLDSQRDDVWLVCRGACAEARFGVMAPPLRHCILSAQGGECMSAAEPSAQDRHN